MLNCTTFQGDGALTLRLLPNPVRGLARIIKKVCSNGAVTSWSVAGSLDKVLFGNGLQVTLNSVYLEGSTKGTNITFSFLADVF